MSLIQPGLQSQALLGRNRLLRAMIDDIADAARAPLDGRERVVAAALESHLHEAGVLDGVSCPCDPARYTRHLLYSDPDGGYAVVAIVWRPGQMSPVHGHRTWCALGIAGGVLTETFFELQGEEVRPVGCVTRRAGDVSHAPPSREAIHRIANLGTQEAVSIHIYGVSFDSFGDGVNHVWAA
jgi:predicted metal-dependent enzyme (double-stranded beta helix superfamily)